MNATSPRARRLARLSFVAAPGMTVEQLTDKLLAATLKHCHGNRTHAARLMNVDVRTIRRWLKSEEPS